MNAHSARHCEVVRLEPNEYIVTAYASPASGPGWANSPICVVILNSATGKMREDCIQPADQTAEMLTLYAFSSLAHSQMTAAVKRATNKSSVGW